MEPKTPKEISEKRQHDLLHGVEEYLQGKLPFDIPLRFDPHFDGKGKFRNAAEKPWRPGDK